MMRVIKEEIRFDAIKVKDGNDVNYFVTYDYVEVITDNRTLIGTIDCLWDSGKRFMLCCKGRNLDIYTTDIVSIKKIENKEHPYNGKSFITDNGALCKIHYSGRGYRIYNAYNDSYVESCNLKDIESVIIDIKENYNE